MDTMSVGFDGKPFTDIVSYLLHNFGVSDPYMCLADYESYMAASERARKAYADSRSWNRMSLVNIAKAGWFSSDRSIGEYATNIWHMDKIR